MIIFNGVIPDGYPGCGMEYILTINILVVMRVGGGLYIWNRWCNLMITMAACGDDGDIGGGGSYSHCHDAWYTRCRETCYDNSRVLDSGQYFSIIVVIMAVVEVYKYIMVVRMMGA